MTNLKDRKVLHPINIHRDKSIQLKEQEIQHRVNTILINKIRKLTEVIKMMLQITKQVIPFRSNNPKNCKLRNLSRLQTECKYRILSTHQYQLIRIRTKRRSKYHNKFKTS